MLEEKEGQWHGRKQKASWKLVFLFSVGAITFPVTVGKCIGKTAVVLRTDTSQFYKWISFAYTLFSLKNWNILGADTHAFENTYRLPC